MAAWCCLGLTHCFVRAARRPQSDATGCSTGKVRLWTLWMWAPQAHLLGLKGLEGGLLR